MLYDMDLDELIRWRWICRVLIGILISLSVAANVLHSGGHGPISMIFNGWPPIPFLLCLEIIYRIPSSHWFRTGLRVAITLGVVAIAGWMSYWQMRGVAAQYGDSHSLAPWFPFTVDGPIAVVSVSLVEIGVRIRAVRRMALAPIEVAKQVVDAEADRLPAPVSAPPAPASIQAAEVEQEARDDDSPGGRNTILVKGPSKPGLNGTPLMMTPPQR